MARARRVPEYLFIHNCTSKLCTRYDCMAETVRAPAQGLSGRAIHSSTGVPPECWWPVRTSALESRRWLPLALRKPVLWMHGLNVSHFWF